MVKPTYKNASGAHYLKALFFEVAVEDDRDHVLYTLKNYDHTFDGKVYPSIQRLYLEMDDPTELQFARTYFDSWKHWKMVCECPWFKPILNDMREELELQIKSNALVRIRKAAVESDKDIMQANRYLLEKGWIDKDDKRGRPSKAKIKEEADKIFKDHEQINDDYVRLQGESGRIKLVG